MQSPNVRRSLALKRGDGFCQGGLRFIFPNPGLLSQVLVVEAGAFPSHIIVARHEDSRRGKVRKVFFCLSLSGHQWALCACAHACMHTYVRTYIRSYAHTYVHRCIDACMRACIHTYVRTYILTYLHTFIHTYTYACACACTCA